MISSKTGPGVNRAAQALRMATQTLYRSQSALGDYFRRKRARFIPGTSKSQQRRMSTMSTGFARLLKAGGVR